MGVNATEVAVEGRGERHVGGWRLNTDQRHNDRPGAAVPTTVSRQPNSPRQEVQ